MKFSATLFVSVLAVSPISAAQSETLWDVPKVNQGLYIIGIAHGIRKNCDQIDANKLRGASFAWSLVGHAKDAGYSMKETRAFIDDDTEKAVLRKRVVAYYKSKGLDPDTPNALCSYGKAEIAKKSQVGVLLRMN